MGVDENNAVCRWQSHQTIRTTTVTFGELSRILAKGNSGLCHCLIETHGGAAAAVTPEDYLGEPWGESGLVLPEKVNSCFHIESRLFEYDLRFVIIETRIHAEHHKSPVSHFAARSQV